MNLQKKTVEYGDFQTPTDLALLVCECLQKTGLCVENIIEPTCGLGEFLLAASSVLKPKNIAGYEINPVYCQEAKARINGIENTSTKITIEQQDFLKTDWSYLLPPLSQDLLVLGNPPWVTNSVLMGLQSENIPKKSNFQAKSGIEALTGAANFDISEWMLLEILRWFKSRNGAIALLIKTSVARKVLMQLSKIHRHIAYAWTAQINSKQYFDVSVDACLLHIKFDTTLEKSFQSYRVYSDLQLSKSVEIGLHDGIWVSDLDKIKNSANHLKCLTQVQGQIKWRSGIKHDAASVCELSRNRSGLFNGKDEKVELEEAYLYPLMKGADVANGARWKEKYILVTQKHVGQNTDLISILAPQTWAYLHRNAEVFNRRGSSIYKNNPQFSIFGVGDYSFKPWKIAICSLYKRLSFELIAPINGQPVMFDDTVYYLSFDCKETAEMVLQFLRSEKIQQLLHAMIFWDEKRPIKSAILNRINLELHISPTKSEQVVLDFA